MADDNKISINVSIDDQNNVNKYINSFNALRSAVNSLSQPLNSFSTNINSLNNNLSKYTESLNDLNKKNQDLINTGNKADNKVSDLSSSFTTWATVIKLVTETLKGWEIALTGGLAVVAVFLPEIINFAKALFKGKEAIDQAKTSLELLNKGLSSGDYSKAIENVTNLTIKVDLAKKGFISKSEVIKEYNQTLGKTIGQVKTLDQVETSLKNNAKDYIQVMLYKASAMAAIKEAADNQVLAQKERSKSDEESIDYWHSGLANSNDPMIKKSYHDRAEQNRIEAAKPFGEKAHAAQAIAEEFLKKAALIEQNNPINKIKKQIEGLQKLTGADVVNSKTFKQIDKLKKELQALDPSSTTSEISTYEPSKPKAKKKQPITPHSEALITAQSTTISQHFENEKKAYDDELALLNGQLDKKLISQAAYNKRSQALQEKYHLGITTINDEFIKTDMDATVKHLQDVAEAEGKLNLDEKNVKKAILPGQKLDAEKQLITDKYNYEIVLANGNAEKIKELEIKKQEALTSVTQQYEQQRKEFALNTAQQVADRAFSIIGNNIKASSDAKIKGLEKDKDGELSNKNLTETQRKVIEDKYQKKENQEKVKAFKAEQRMSVLQAVVNGALAITKVTAQSGIFAPFVIPGIIASTALQIATIVAQKPPAFAKGGRFVSDGRGALLPGYSRTDNTNAFLRSGEAVVVSEAMRNPWARNLVSAINVAHGGRDFSMPNTGRGYAIGGIFTDGGNANRYYNQPVNDAKELANTLAYQMINNFPPIYVDVKDVNNQQNILAQTVNRVNL